MMLTVLALTIGLWLISDGRVLAAGGADGPSPAAATNIAGFASLRLTSMVGGSALPFSAGYAFREGDVPAGKYIIATGAALRGFQAVVKNRWHDGSVKFAILAGLADLQPRSELKIMIGSGDVTVDGGAPLGIKDLEATGIAASIAFGDYGKASWQGSDWDAPFISVAAGPQMSSWVYRRPIGADRHLVAWVEVRLYRGGAVELLPWIENGYLLRPLPGERTGAATLAINGTTRFSGEIALRNHQRVVLADGDALSHWLGADPRVSYKHDMRYLQDTRLVPAYSGITPPNASLYKHLSTRYTPLAQHDFPSGMGAGGYDKSIGPLPEWDVVYMTSDGDPRAWYAVQVNGYAAGRYGIHFRDESTNRAPRLSSYPNLVIGPESGIASTGTSSKRQLTPDASGEKPPVFKSSHMPAIGFMAYLMTGRWYFLDETQLLASTLLLKQSDANRLFSQGVIQSAVGTNTTRGAAWALRALADSAAITPDDDQPLKSALAGSVQANVDWYYTRYIAQSSNPLGLVQPYSDYTPGDGKIDSASWMEDFLTWSFGNIKALAICDDRHDAKLAQFLAWKYRSVVGRLGPNQSGSWSYRRAAAYTVPYAPSESPDWTKGTGPWYHDWGEAYLAAKLGYEDGSSLLGAYIDGAGLATSYWGNLQPAIAYAVEQNAPGALEAYKRMTGAPNWRAAAAYFDRDTPVWSVRPRNLGD
jgi:hypothetical protein